MAVYDTCFLKQYHDEKSKPPQQQTIRLRAIFVSSARVRQCQSHRRSTRLHADILLVSRSTPEVASQVKLLSCTVNVDATWIRKERDGLLDPPTPEVQQSNIAALEAESERKLSKEATSSGAASSWPGRRAEQLRLFGTNSSGCSGLFGIAGV